MKKVIILLMALIISFSVCSCSNEKSDDSLPKSTQNTEDKKDAEVKETGKKEDDNIGAENALESAKSYLSFMPFSYKGLISQLEYEGYTTEEATHAADNCGADWNKQALNNAKNYLESMAFSYKGLINQLEYEGYTNEEATYAAENCSADWNEQAAKKAADYLDLEDTSFSEEKLIEQLEFEGFTYEQAVYGAKECGY